MPRAGPASTRPRARRWRRYVLLVVAIALVGPAAITVLRCAFAKHVANEAAPQDAEHVRDAKSRIAGHTSSSAATYFTLPEWLIASDAEEYASHVKSGRPSGFAYFRSIPRFWSYYQGVCDAACGRYPFDGGNHLMLAIIGTSQSVENFLKGLYEST